MLPGRATAAPLGPCRNVWRPQLLGSFLSAQRHLARCRRKLETVIFCCLFFVGETIQRLIAENLHCTADTTNHAIKIRNTLLPHPQLFCSLRRVRPRVRLRGAHQQHSFPRGRTQPRTRLKPLLFCVYTALPTCSVL